MNTSKTLNQCNVGDFVHIPNLDIPTHRVRGADGVDRTPDMVWRIDASAFCDGTYTLRARNHTLLNLNASTVVQGASNAEILDGTTNPWM